VLARAAAAEGFDVKLSEVHGMSQRGGSVDTTVRFGEKVHAPIVDAGMVDVLVGFELTEAARWIGHLKPEGALVVNGRTIPPLPVLIGEYAPTRGLIAALEVEGAHIIDAEAIACSTGSPRSANIVLMGALSTLLPFEEATWREVIAGRVPPTTVDKNLAAFGMGRSVLSRAADAEGA
jgi:indolepyruvate ferredoxin oxidoreductase beta subunit